MICYKDVTWCSQPNCRNECGRKFTEEDRQKAIRWWGDEDFPICFGEFCDKDGKKKVFGVDKNDQTALSDNEAESEAG